MKQGKPKKPPVTVAKQMRRTDTLDGRPRDDKNWIAKVRAGKAGQQANLKPVTLPKFSWDKPSKNGGEMAEKGGETENASDKSLKSLAEVKSGGNGGERKVP